MKRVTIILFAIINILCFSGLAQESNQEIGTIEFISDELVGLIKKEARIEVIAKGFQ